MRELFTTCIEVVGFVCLVASAFTVSFTLGLVATGIACILLGFLVGRG